MVLTVLRGLEAGLSVQGRSGRIGERGSGFETIPTPATLVSKPLSHELAATGPPRSTGRLSPSQASSSICRCHHTVEMIIGKRRYFGDYRFSEDLDFTLTSVISWRTPCQRREARGRTTRVPVAPEIDGSRGPQTPEWR